MYSTLVPRLVGVTSQEGRLVIWLNHFELHDRIGGGGRNGLESRGGRGFIGRVIILIIDSIAIVRNIDNVYTGGEGRVEAKRLRAANSNIPMRNLVNKFWAGGC